MPGPHQECVDTRGQTIVGSRPLAPALPLVLQHVLGGSGLVSQPPGSVPQGGLQGLLEL